MILNDSAASYFTCVRRFPWVLRRDARGSCDADWIMTYSETHDIRQNPSNLNKQCSRSGLGVAANGDQEEHDQSKLAVCIRCK